MCVWLGIEKISIPSVAWDYNSTGSSHDKVLSDFWCLNTCLESTNICAYFYLLLNHMTVYMLSKFQ